MTAGDTYNLLMKDDPFTKRTLFEELYPYMSSVALRFSKNETQARELVRTCFDSIVNSYIQSKNRAADFSDYLQKEFAGEAVGFIKSIRSEYYMSSTVYAPAERDKTINLFDSNEIIDHNTADTPVVTKSIQDLVPSQRLVFNLFVVDGLSTEQISEILETSEQTVKSNLEKARYHFQKNIEKHYKQQKHEQAL